LETAQSVPQSREEQVSPVCLRYLNGLLDVIGRFVPVSLGQVRLEASGGVQERLRARSRRQPGRCRRLQILCYSLLVHVPAEGVTKWSPAIYG
jgi:hypothetical protein